MRRILFACAAVVPALVAGCTPAAQPTPSATPVPTVAAPTLQLMCTPEEGGTASPCTQAEYDAMIARDKLYDEAKAVLAKFNEESEALLRAGATASPDLLAMTVGKGTEITAEGHPSGIRWEGGEFRREWVKRLGGQSKEGSVVALELCTDASTVRATDGVDSIDGVISSERFYFAGSEGALRIALIEFKEVPKC